MRMGGAPKQENQSNTNTNKNKPGAAGGGIMSGLDELEGLWI